MNSGGYGTVGVHRSGMVPEVFGVLWAFSSSVSLSLSLSLSSRL